MFSSMELMLIVLVTLLVIGPERLPETLRTLGLWVGRLSRSFTATKVEIEKEIGMDDVRRQLHNESVMAQMRHIEDEVKNAIEPSVMQKPPIASATAEVSEKDAKGVATNPVSPTQTDSPQTTITDGEAKHHSPKTFS